MARLSSKEPLAMVFDPDFDSGGESEIEDSSSHANPAAIDHVFLLVNLIL